MKKQYNKHIIQAVRQNFYLDKNDNSKDEMIMKLNKKEILRRCLVWEGLLNHDDYILNLINGIYNVDLWEE